MKHVLPSSLSLSLSSLFLGRFPFAIETEAGLFMNHCLVPSNSHALSLSLTASESFARFRTNNEIMKTLMNLYRPRYEKQSKFHEIPDLRNETRKTATEKGHARTRIDRSSRQEFHLSLQSTAVSINNQKMKNRLCSTKRI